MAEQSLNSEAKEGFWRHPIVVAIVGAIFVWILGIFSADYLDDVFHFRKPPLPMPELSADAATIEHSEGGVPEGGVPVLIVPITPAPYAVRIEVAKNKDFSPIFHTEEIKDPFHPGEIKIGLPADVNEVFYRLAVTAGKRSATSQTFSIKVPPPKH